MHKKRYFGWVGTLVLGAMFVITMGSVTTSDAATYHVALTGNDNQAGTATQPFRTVRKGASRLQAGDTLIVHAGTYKENLGDVFPSGQSWSQPVTVQAAQRGSVTLSPPGPTDVFLFFSGTDTKYIVLDGFVIDGQNLVGFGAYITAGAERIRLVNCEVKNTKSNGILVTSGNQPGHTMSCCNEFINVSVHDTGTGGSGHGIYVSTSNNLIERSRFYHNTGYGIHVYSSFGGVNNNIVRYNEVYDNNIIKNPAGVIVASGRDNVVYNNLIWNNRGGLVISSPGAKAYNNTIYNNRKPGDDAHGILILNNATGVTIKNNIVYRNNAKGIFGITSAVIHDNNLLNTDPLFVSESEYDFRLRAGSPAIDTGVALTEVHDDIDGTLRPQGSKPDIGAYEYIDLQKMNWKFETGFHEHTGVSLQAHLPNHPTGGYTRVHQNTAQSCDRQRPPQVSSARLSAR